MSGSGQTDKNSKNVTQNDGTPLPTSVSKGVPAGKDNYPRPSTCWSSLSIIAFTSPVLPFTAGQTGNEHSVKVSQGYEGNIRK